MALQVGPIKLTRGQIAALVGFIALALGLALFYRQIDLPALHARAARLNGGVVFALLAVLPLLGFPVTVLHVVVGVRFGPWVGIGLVALATLFHLLASFVLVKAMPQFFARKLEGLRRRLPHGAHAPVTLFALLVPGAPYWAINYVLPLAGVRLRVYLPIAFPLHLLRSMISIWFGEISDHLTALRLLVLVAYWVVVLTCCGLSWRWLQARLEDLPPKVGDPKPAV